MLNQTLLSKLVYYITSLHYLLLTDERALVLAAERLGYVFTTRTPHYIKVEVVRPVIDRKLLF